MIRHFWLLFLFGCAGAATREEGPLDRLITKSNAYASFHLRAEISDGKQSVPIEMAWKAPDRAILKYGAVATTILSGGSVHHFLRGTYTSLPTAPVLAELRERYPGLSIGPAPEAVFTLGDGVRAQLGLGRLGARLGWLEDLKTYKVEGNVYKHGQTVIELREDGFIGRTEMAGTRFIVKDLAINQPVADSVFALPPTAGLQDVGARSQIDFARGLDESYHRWILETSTDDNTLETLIKIDLARKVEPEKMAALLSESVQKGLKAFHLLHPDARPQVMRDKLAIDHGRAMGNLEILEEELHKEYEKTLESYFRGMAVAPPQKETLDVARRWQAALKRQVDAQIRKRFEAVFEAALAAQKE
jgi:hypothetical protein